MVVWNLVFENTLQPWNLSLTKNSCKASSKTCKTSKTWFWFLWFPKFAYQGSHILLGYDDTPLFFSQNVRQIACLKWHTVRFFVVFLKPFSNWVWTVWSQAELTGNHVSRNLNCLHTLCGVLQPRRVYPPIRSIIGNPQ